MSNNNPFGYQDPYQDFGNKPPIGTIRPFNGLPGQDGTGPDFPTSPNLPLNQYPRVNNAMDDMKYDVFDEVGRNKYWDPEGVQESLDYYTQPGEKWNVSSNPAFPGTNAQGQTEYGQFGGKVVTGDFLNHHLYGVGMAAQSKTPTFGLNMSVPLPGQQPYDASDVPDHLYDTNAIASGHKAFMGDNSWKQQSYASNGLADSTPQMPVWDNTPLPHTTSPSPTTTDGSPVTIHGEVSKQGQDNTTTPDSVPQPDDGSIPPTNPQPDTQQDTSGDNNNDDDDDDDTLSQFWDYLGKAAGGVGAVYKRQHDLAQQEADQNSGNNNQPIYTQNPLPQTQQPVSTGTYMGVPVAKQDITGVYQTDLMRHTQGLPTMSGQEIADYPQARDIHQNWVTQQFTQAARPNSNTPLAKVMRQYHWDTSGLGNQGVKANQVASTISGGVSKTRYDAGSYTNTSSSLYPRSNPFTPPRTNPFKPFEQSAVSHSRVFMVPFPPGKDKEFPTSSNLPISAYPDVTKELLDFRNKAIQEARWTMKNKGLGGVVKLFHDNFPTGAKWDTKSWPQFPNTQYALYKGNIVPGSYIANNFYGQVSAGVGLPLWAAKEAAEIDCVKVEVTHNRPPHLDQPEDQWAIESGYYDYFYNNPWMKGTHPPKTNKLI